MQAAGPGGVEQAVSNSTAGDPYTRVVSGDMSEPLAQKIAGPGWHVQISMPVDASVANATMLGCKEMMHE